MPIPAAYTGADWWEIFTSLWHAAEKQNGVSHDGPDQTINPRVTNATALAIAQGWRKLLKAYKIASGPFWPELWYAALGYRKTGDRFQMTHAHAAAEAPEDVRDALWRFAGDAARKLDEVSAQPKLLALDLTFRGYEQAAQVAYDQLKEDRKRKRVPAPPTPPGVPRPPDVDLPDPQLPLPVVPSPDLRGVGMLLALLLIAFAVSGNSKRR